MINKYSILFFAALALCFVSCESPLYTNRAFVVGKTDDDNWSCSAMIYCDSVDMVSATHAKYWIDGNIYNLHAVSFVKVANNPDYKTENN